MTEFRRAWAVLARVTSTFDQTPMLDVLRVFWDEADARAEAERLQAQDPNEDHVYYVEETEVERAL